MGTPFQRLTLRAPVRLAVPNARGHWQQAPAGATLFSNDGGFLSLARQQPAAVTFDGPPAPLPGPEPEDWPMAGMAGRRVLFLVQPRGIGDNVGLYLAARTLMAGRRPGAIGFACAGNATDVFALDPRFRLHPLWITAADLASYDLVFDIGRLPEWSRIATEPLELETLLAARFGLSPPDDPPAAGRPVPAGRLRIGLLPLASSPLRTLPPALTRRLAAGLSGLGEVTIVLNDAQGQGRLYREALEGSGLLLLGGLASIADLLDLLARLDYAVFADSGPAHLAKLAGLPGTAIYTCADPGVLQGRFRNLRAVLSGWSGPHCASPCGLARLRQGGDGAVGCMGSLGRPLAALPRVVRQPDPAMVRRLLIDTPVPCVGRLVQDADAIMSTILADLEDRRA